MKVFPTTDEASMFLSQIANGECPEQDACVMLMSISFCLAAGNKGYNLWGKDIERVMPLFNEAYAPEEEDEEFKENLDAYLQAREEALKYATEG